jgi:hypothetical protein
VRPRPRRTRVTSKTDPRGTAGAIREWGDHVEKGRGFVKNLDRILNKERLSDDDFFTAVRVRNDIYVRSRAGTSTAVSSDTRRTPEPAMSTELSYERLNDQMVDAIPTLDVAYQSELDWWDDEPAPSHVIFGQILNPYLTERLVAGDREALTEVFTFLERMASDVDPRIQDVLRDTVLEHIRDETSALRRLASDHMGPSTLVHWQEVTGGL